MIDIPANDHGQIRVFATDQQIKDATPDMLEQLFGAPLDMTYVDVVRIADLGDMRLGDYIAAGYDMPADPVDLAAVNGIRGTAILVLSRATEGREATLTLAPGLRHVTTYSPNVRITTPEPMPSEAAKGTIAGAPQKPAKSNARIGGMVAMYALLFMFALVGLMIWVGG